MTVRRLIYPTKTWATLFVQHFHKWMETTSIYASKTCDHITDRLFFSPAYKPNVSSLIISAHSDTMEKKVPQHATSLSCEFFETSEIVY